ncbi:glycosyltransferase [Nocardia sp. NPDC052566]|uniref:glycosyltransferase n=1 Tax=Nocardia sp. NPDC052566 TaxID=3364330 RepID=UPI0037C5013A
MNIALLGQGTRGDLYPLLGIGRSLVERGHRVVVLEYDEYASDIEEAGLDFHLVATGSQCAHVFENVPVGPATPSTELATHRLYFDASLRSARHFVAALTRLAQRPDAIVAPSHHLGAGLGGEMLGIPVISTFLGASVPATFDTGTGSGMRSRPDERMARLVDRLALPRIAEVRRDIGLDPAPDGATFARVDREGGLVLTASPLATLPPGIPPAFEIVGYPDYYGSDRHRLDEPTRRFLTESEVPVVVCTLGDGWARTLPDQLREFLDRADRGRYRVLMIGGRVPGLSSGAGTRIVARANLREVLAYADVSVNHGGMGTLIAALRCAVPSVMMTQWPDGRRNAAALAAQGLGIDLGSAPTADEFIRAVDEAIGSDMIEQRLTAASTAMRAERDPVDALLDRLHRERKGTFDHAETSTGRRGASR